MTRAALLLTTVSLLAAAAPSYAQLKTVETDGVRLVYFEGADSYLVPHAARGALASLAFQQRVFGFRPSGEISILLHDLSDSGNAAAASVPYNGVRVQIAPLSLAFETLPGYERIHALMNHELVHIAAMDQAAGRDRFFRRLFAGKVLPVAEQPESILYFFLTSPRVAAPRWYQEGAAVFFDTWMAGGLGRAQSGYDEMVFRAMVKDGTPFHDPLTLTAEGTQTDFQLEMNSYLYGTRFMTWLARRYSPERLVEWVARGEGSRAYYASQFERAFGTPMDQAWRAWTADEQAFQRDNLERIREHTVTRHDDLTQRALGSVSRAHYDQANGKLYAAFNYPGVVAHLGAIDLTDGRLERLADVKGPLIYSVASLAFDPWRRTLFYTSDNGAQRDLLSLDLATNSTTLLQRDARIGDFAFDASDGSLWGIRHASGLCTLVHIAPPYRDWQQVLTFPYGTVVYDLDVSPDGARAAASFGEISGEQEVRVLSTEALRQGDATPVARFGFGTAIPNNFVFSPDGRFLYGSAYHTGVSNIFRYEIENRQLEAVSNTETGFFRPVPTETGELIVFRYTGLGFVPARIEGRPVADVSAITFLGQRLAEERPVVKSWIVEAPAGASDQQLPARPAAYSPAGRLRLESLYPVVQGYKDATAFGVRANFSDPLQLNRLYVSAAYTPGSAVPADERLHLTADYQRFDWRARLEWNRADFYDLVGPRKASRKGYFASLGHKTTLVFDPPRRLELDLDATVAGKLDRIPEHQNVPVAVERAFSLGASLSYTHVRRSLGSVDDEKGRRAILTLRGGVVDGHLIPRLWGSFDQGVALDQPHSSLWLRQAAGFSPVSRTDPFANFYFGSFGNNLVDHLEVKRYRELSSFPGADIDALAGRNFMKSTLEWTLPPWRFRHAGTPGFHARWARPALFTTGLATNLDAPEARRLAASFGAQLDVRFSLLSTLDLTLSFGVALAFERHRPPGSEGMISLKVLN